MLSDVVKILPQGLDQAGKLHSWVLFSKEIRKENLVQRLANGRGDSRNARYLTKEQTAALYVVSNICEVLHNFLVFNCVQYCLFAVCGGMWF